MNKKPTKFIGKVFSDDRGKLKFVPDFSFKNVKRFYHIENKDMSIIRGFHGHMKEEKYVYVVEGSLLLCLVELTNKKNPSKESKVYKFVLKAENPEVVHVPAGFANGFRALEKNTRIIFYSTSTAEESQEDDYRFPIDYWGKDIWEVEK